MMADDPPPPTSSRKNEKMGTLVSSEAELRRRPGEQYRLDQAAPWDEAPRRPEPMEIKLADEQFRSVITHFRSVITHLRIIIGLLGFTAGILVALAWAYL